MSICCGIGVVACDQAALADGPDFLSLREQRRYQSIAIAARKKRWLRGRLAAKHLFLAGMGTRDCKPVDSWPPHIHWLDQDDFRDFPQWAYRQVEIVPRCQGSAVPRVWWAENLHLANVSLAHTSAYSVACVGSGAVGVDLEVPVTRDPAFYRATFSIAERAWVERLQVSGRVDVERAYTLLWCLKEAGLKLRQSDGISLWQVPRMEIKVHTSTEVALEILSGTSLDGPFTLLDLEFRTDGHIASAEAAVITSPDAVLAVVRNFDRDWDGRHDDGPAGRHTERFR